MRLVPTCGAYEECAYIPLRAERMHVTGHRGNRREREKGMNSTIGPEKECRRGSSPLRDRTRRSLSEPHHTLSGDARRGDDAKPHSPRREGKRKQTTMVSRVSQSRIQLSTTDNLPTPPTATHVTSEGPPTVTARGRKQPMSIRSFTTLAVLIQGGFSGCPGMPDRRWRVRRVVWDGDGREAVARRGGSQQKARPGDCTPGTRGPIDPRRRCSSAGQGQNGRSKLLYARSGSRINPAPGRRYVFAEGAPRPSTTQRSISR